MVTFRLTSRMKSSRRHSIRCSRSPQALCGPPFRCFVTQTLPVTMQFVVVSTPTVLLVYPGEAGGQPLRSRVLGSGVFICSNILTSTLHHAHTHTHTCSLPPPPMRTRGSTSGCTRDKSSRNYTRLSERQSTIMFRRVHTWPHCTAKFKYAHC